MLLERENFLKKKDNFRFQKLEPSDTFRNEKKFLILTGFYPIIKKSVYYNVSTVINVFASFGQFFSMLIQIFLETDLSKIIDILYYLMTQTAYLVKLINFIIKRRNMFVIEEICKVNVFNLQQRHQYRFLKEAHDSTEIVAVIFRLLCCGVVLFYGVFPVIDNNYSIKPPLSGWYPMDKEKYRILIYFFQIVAVGLSAFSNSNIDLLNMKLISMGSAQLDILMDNLQNLVPTNINDQEEIDNVVEKKLKIHVIHHNTILR